MNQPLEVLEQATRHRYHVPARADLLPDEEPVRLLSPDGTLTQDERYPLDLDDHDLQQLYRYMVLGRRLDDESIKLQRQGQLAVYTSCLGQEGAQVGSAYALRRDDWIFPSYREHAVARVRDVDPVRLLHHSRGTWVSAHDPREWRFASQAVSIGTQIIQAAGLATAAQFAEDDIVVMTYFGDGATSEGVTHEGMNWASVFQAPIVFFCQNNGWAISVPVSRQLAAPTIAHRGIAYGMPGIRVDGNDVLASYAVSRVAVDRARSGGGPTLIEALTYRMEAHSTADDPTRYRGGDELAFWSAQDPLERYQLFLSARGLLDDAFVAEVAQESADMCARVRSEIYDAPHGDPAELFEHVYEGVPAHLAAQRAQLQGEIAAARGDAS
ncbi:pyruvate dehydrogenase (acetyl-transferring) E1 component subunit alpha [Jatrophihabitans cynanchi]|uniref:Pyruvate dehydrogenase (Acetyl-transferring) E1 component subunit alpha n=1 Tax=Jatrophihabitans cynanchi TaxID=2944128 RepID=A0ABY7K140_9ACTN|nr:pyruvate dehydrogenase (acetyl-transferring) E1 component subunit alpha [Jatrophihabitans sp. SB3-54]WAX58384.1 pyruvate dehydrogenase (acetyl-transferring) E1 component subunit alpha [Jatrophihabitans sp. SB3-54]